MIKIENLYKTYKIDGHHTDVLKDINIDIKAGDVFGIVGKTGSGKSTLLRLINGFIVPDQGSIYINNELLTKQSRKQIIKETSMIFQNYNLLNNLNAIDNVLLPIKLRKLDVKKYYVKAVELLEFVGLKNLLTSNISNLSGGEKQRVAIARALITNPKIIFCDEPTSALDDETTHEVLSLLKTINKKYNTTIIIVSHNINVINMMCNRIAIIEEGIINDVISKTPTPLKFSSYREAIVND